MARLLADENFPFPVTQELRRLGHDVVTLEDLGKVDQRLSDDAVLALATEQDRAVLTINSDRRRGETSPRGTSR